MPDPGSNEAPPDIMTIRAQAESGLVRVSLHALDEMVDEGITLDEVLQAIATGRVIENYPEHRRGPCCLLYGVTENGRDLHVVCTTGRPVLLVITTYEPKPPKFVSPSQRST